MKILLFCCKGFETMEFAPFVDICGWARDEFGYDVCVGALPVAKSGALTGRKATTYHLSGGERQRQLASLGADVIPDQRVVTDRNIITSFCPETAADVALRLLEFLLGEEKAADVRGAMGY